MIEVYHVSKSFQGRQALQDINLKIDKGEFVYLTGASGAGKTTLLRLIFRAETPDEGHVLVNNQNLTEMKESAVPYLRRSMGIIFQDFRLLPRKTVFENVASRKDCSGGKCLRRFGWSAWMAFRKPCHQLSPRANNSESAWRGPLSTIP